MSHFNRNSKNALLAVEIKEGSWNCPACNEKMSEAHIACAECGQRIRLDNEPPADSIKGNGTKSAINQKTYPIRYGSAWAVDGFGFVGKGTLDIDDSEIKLHGRMAVVGRNIIDVVGIALVIWKGLIWLPLLLLRFAFVTNPKTVVLQKVDVREVSRKGRRITFLATVPNSKRLKRSRFRLDNEESAKSVEELIRTLSVQGKDKKN